MPVKMTDARTLASGLTSAATCRLHSTRAADLQWSATPASHLSDDQTHARDDLTHPLYIRSTEPRAPPTMTGRVGARGDPASARFHRRSRAAQRWPDASGARDRTCHHVRSSPRSLSHSHHPASLLTGLTLRALGHKVTPRPVTRQLEPERATKFYKWLDSLNLRPVTPWAASGHCFLVKNNSSPSLTSPLLV
jgi:hypothetical protein